MNFDALDETCKCLNDLLSEDRLITEYERDFLIHAIDTINTIKGRVKLLSDGNETYSKTMRDVYVLPKSVYTDNQQIDDEAIIHNIYD